MEETIIFIDTGFLEKLSKYFGNGRYLKFDRIKLSKQLAKKQDLFCKHIFYYTAPPFQDNFPTEEQIKLKEGYDMFIKRLGMDQTITIREGRIQKTFNEKGKTIFKQKGVDTLMTIDLIRIKDNFPNIKKILLISSDTDFCPVIKDIQQKDRVEVILCTYFDRKRKSEFSLSNHLISCCSECIKITKEDFDNSPLIKSNQKELK